ncbi:MAG: orotate phosphoribosyltransferase [Planctomycetota bacterium]|nr:MAG: orotate phosphoribosyltransferase [Planctomycetota bacterium]
MNEDFFVEQLKSLGGLWIHGGGAAPHALLTSGRHSNGYVNMTKVIENPMAAGDFCRALINALTLKGKPDVVAGSAMGAITIAYQVAAVYGGRTRAVYTEKVGSEMVLKRFDIAAGEKVLVVEDTMTTGGTTVKTIQALKAAGCDVLPVCGVLVNRSGKSELDIPGEAEKYKIVEVIKLDIESWDADKCPLCSAGSKALRPKENWKILNSEL